MVVNSGVERCSGKELRSCLPRAGVYSYDSIHIKRLSVIRERITAGMFLGLNVECDKVPNRVSGRRAKREGSGFRETGTGLEDDER